MPKINFEYHTIILFSLFITVFCLRHFIRVFRICKIFKMFYRIKLKKKTDVNKCSAKHVVFEASVNVNNIPESVL